MGFLLRRCSRFLDTCVVGLFLRPAAWRAGDRAALCNGLLTTLSPGRQLRQIVRTARTYARTHARTYLPYTYPTKAQKREASASLVVVLLRA